MIWANGTVTVMETLAQLDGAPGWSGFPEQIVIAKQQCDTAGREDLKPQFDQILERWVVANDQFALLRIECGDATPPESQHAYQKAALSEWIRTRIGDLSDAARVGYAQSGRGTVIALPDARKRAYKYITLDTLQQRTTLREDIKRVTEYDPAVEAVLFVAAQAIDSRPDTGWLTFFRLDGQS
jgi:hypothetical protein